MHLGSCEGLALQGVPGSWAGSRSQKINGHGHISDLIGFGSDLVRVDARVFPCGLNGTLHWIAGYVTMAGLKILKCLKCPVDLCH